MDALSIRILWRICNPQRRGDVRKLAVLPADEDVPGSRCSLVGCYGSCNAVWVVAITVVDEQVLVKKQERICTRRCRRSARALLPEE